MDLSEFVKNHRHNVRVSSDFTRLNKSVEYIMGIDEAGRGPVLGPMVYGCCIVPKTKANALKETGVADSKTLTEERRETLFGVLDGLTPSKSEDSNQSSSNNYLGWSVELLSPVTISAEMLARSRNSLNDLSHNAAAGLIQLVLDSGINLANIYVDTVGPPETYQAKLSLLFPGPNITVSKKADALFPIVSAASICAKVARDRALSQWKFIEPGVGERFNASTDMGSGYPADPKTKKFIVEASDRFFGFPDIVRFSWQTADTLLKKQGAVNLKWTDDSSDDENSGSKSRKKKRKTKDESVKPLTEFFANSQKPVNGESSSIWPANTAPYYPVALRGSNLNINVDF